MKNLTIFFILAVAISVIVGCKKIASVIYNVHTPQSESIDNIIHFCLKRNIDTSALVLIHEDWILNSLYKDLNHSILFDREGYSIDFNASAVNPVCGGNIFGILEGIGKETYFPRDSVRTFNEETKRWISTKGHPIKNNIRKLASDYVVVYYWNTFSGTPNHKWQIRNLKEKITNNKRVTIQLIIVNQDIRTDINFKQKAIEYKKLNPTKKE